MVRGRTFKLNYIDYRILFCVRTNSYTTKVNLVALDLGPSSDPGSGLSLGA